jgi:hypothetical protein
MVNCVNVRILKVSAVGDKVIWPDQNGQYNKESVHIIKYTIVPGNTIKVWLKPNSKPGTIQRQVVSSMPPAAVPTWKGHPLPTEQETGWVPQPVWIPRRGKNLLSLLGIELKFHGYSAYSLVTIMTTQSWLHKTTKLKLTFNIHGKFLF